MNCNLSGHQLRRRVTNSDRGAKSQCVSLRTLYEFLKTHVVSKSTSEEVVQLFLFRELRSVDIRNDS